MEFSRKKLPEEAAPTLRLCPIETVQPYAPILAPAYVLMKMNGKYVSVKGPLDFFTPAELERYRSFEVFFFPEFVEFALPFREAARGVKALLNWNPRGGRKLAPAPYEISDAVLRIIGPLWGAEARLEPFFISIFTNELCEPISPELLQKLRDESVDAYERALFCSGWVVFLALHLGFCNLGFLNRLRMITLDCIAEGTGHASSGSEFDELVAYALETIPDSRLAVIEGATFLDRPDRISQKLVWRLERVASEFISPDRPMATIFGEKGFQDGRDG